MSSLSFPDVNVWLALSASEHTHHDLARRWWEQQTGSIAFCRLTQIGFLRLLTNRAAMDAKPLTLREAWSLHDRLYDDERVIFMTEPPEVERRFRDQTRQATVSPKLWSDAWLLAFARSAAGTLVTFDRALAARGAFCLLPGEGEPATCDE
jgi:uncharacterized protein